MLNKYSYTDWFSKRGDKSPKEKGFLLPKQKEVAIQMFEHLYCRDIHTAILDPFPFNLIGGKSAAFLNGGVGIGKTFILGKFLVDFFDADIPHCLESQGIFCWCSTPVAYITKASVIEQTKRVLEKQFSLSCTRQILLTNYDQLRSKFGEQYIKRETRIEWGREYEVFIWNPVYPILIIWDEGQALKNETSLQSQVGQSYNELLETNPLIRQVFSSATLFTKVAEAKCFAVATQMEIGD